jgi:hypothetical protein
MVRAAYLGDGVFVRFEPDRMILTASNGILTTDTIVLEPNVWAQLLRVVRQYHDRDWPFVATEEA